MQPVGRKVLLIVNTATKCGLTPQFEGLQKLQDKFHDKGFPIYKIIVKK